MLAAAVSTARSNAGSSVPCGVIRTRAALKAVELAGVFEQCRISAPAYVFQDRRHDPLGFVQPLRFAGRERAASL